MDDNKVTLANNETKTLVSLLPDSPEAALDTILA